MKVAKVNSGNNSVSFGRALGPEEMKKAYQTSRDARAALGFKDGSSILVLPSDKIPKTQDAPTLKGQLDSFLGYVKNILGINSVEIVGDVDAQQSATIYDTLSEQGISVYKKLGFSEPDKLEQSVRDLAKSSYGIRIEEAHKYTPEQLTLIEDTFKAAKGEKFDPKMLIFDAHKDGGVFDWSKPSVSDKFKGRIITGSSDWANNEGGLWGTASFHTDRMGIPQGEFVHGLRKKGEASLWDIIQDTSGGSQFAKGQGILKDELRPVVELSEPRVFAAAKRADVAMSKHLYKHFDDLIPDTNVDIAGFEAAYNASVQKGYADNWFDSLERVMSARGLDKTQSDLYSRVVGFRNAIFAKGATTAADLASSATEEINSSYSDVSNIVIREAERRKAANAALEALSDPLPKNNFNKILDTARKNKALLAFGGVVALSAVVIKTMSSYNKEIQEKSQIATPKSERVLDKEA